MISERNLSERDQALLKELTPYVEQGYESHLGKLKTTPINPPILLSQSAGVESSDLHDYGPVIRDSFNAHVSRLLAQDIDVIPVVESTFLMNTLTEDNLPAYSRENGKVADQNEALQTWLGQWIAEEQSHSTLLYLYGLHSGLLGNYIDLEYYQKAKDRQLKSGMDVEINGLAQGFSYLSLQEDATGISHENLGWVLDKPGFASVRKMSGDEWRHRDFYAGLVKGLFEIDPDGTLESVAWQFEDKNFHMPGRLGIENFDELAKVIAIAGIFDPAQLRNAKHNLLTKRWKVQDLEPKSDGAKAAQEKLLNDTDPASEKTQKNDRRMDSIRDRIVTRQKKAGKLTPLILGLTVELDKTTKQLMAVD